MKRSFKYLHLIFGLISGLVIFSVSLSGSMVSYDEELRDLIYSNLYNVDILNAPKISFDKLKTKVESNFPNFKIKAVKVHKKEGRSVEFILSNKKSLFINPYDASVIGFADKNNDFLAKVLKFHRSFFLDDTGKWITGISTLVFLFMIISGIILWWPKTINAIKYKLFFKRNVHQTRRIYDLHSVLGFYCSILLIFTALSALVFSFKWADKALYSLTGSKKEKRLKINSLAKDSNSTILLSNVYESVNKQFPNHSECIISFPEKKMDSYRLTCRYENLGFYRRIDNMFVDQYDGKVLKVKKFSELSAGLKLRITAENIHTGKSFGTIGRFLIFLAGICCASLPITGFLLWHKKNYRLP